MIIFPPQPPLPILPATYNNHISTTTATTDTACEGRTTRTRPRHLFGVRQPGVPRHGEEQVLGHGRGLGLGVEGLVNHLHLRAPRHRGVGQVRLEVGVVADDLQKARAGGGRGTIRGFYKV